MLFDDLDDATRERLIRWLENSLFDRCTQGAIYFHDVVPTLPGFAASLAGSTPNYQVHIPPGFLKA